MRFLPEPIAWTQAPESLGDLARQRARWQRGSLETHRKHRQMSLNPRYGAVGLIGFGQLLAVDVIGAPVTVMGYVLVPLFWMTGLLSDDHFLAYVAMVFAIGILVSVLSLILEQILLARIERARDLATLAAIAVVENFGYRQLCNWWRIVGWYQYLRKQEGWGPMQRQEFKKT
jgi:cellulose synthase/poly-beta-1,6-N-acetylglucosamine synthase-like glycosyltransferase